VGEIEEELAHWWETFQNASDEIREDMVDAQRKVNQPKGGAGGARRVKRSDADHPASASESDPRFRPAGEAENDEDDDNAPAEAGAPADGTAPAKKRRRRRRKPGGGTGAAGQGGATEGSGD
jgi:poly(A) polymerase